MLRVAIAVPDPDVVAMVSEILAEDGWEVLPCISGQALWDSIAQPEPDLIVLSTWLDRSGSGWDEFTRLRDCSRTASIPIILWPDLPEDLIRAHDLADSRTAIMGLYFDLQDLHRAVRQLGLGPQATHS